MRQKMRMIKATVTVLSALIACVALAACGGSSGNANTLLQQTFSGHHTVNSGNLSFSVTVDPSGSTSLTTPLSLSFGGPFQNLGAGKLPQSNFTVSISGFGKSGSLAILSTGTNGYVTMSGTSYQLPSATYQKLESSFASLSKSPGSSGGSTLSSLGINPLRWLQNPSIVGQEDVAGASTTHIRAGINVAALLADLNTFLGKTSSLGGGRIPSSIPPTTQQRIASEVEKPSFDVWTGNGDKTVRKLAISLTLPVTGPISALLGGLHSAAVGITMQYANLNQPQTISAPTSVRPFTEFEARMTQLLQGLRSTLGVGTTGGTTTGGGTGGGTTGGGTTGTTPSGTTSYTQCIQAAGGDITKMQKCASLLGGG